MLLFVKVKFDQFFSAPESGAKGEKQMKESTRIKFMVVAGAICVGLMGYAVGFEIERRVMTPQMIHAKQDIRELENRLAMQGYTWAAIIKAGVVVKQVETVLGGSSLAKAGAPVNSLAVTADDGRIFVVSGYSYNSEHGWFPRVDVYQWETENPTRQLLKKLRN